MDTLITLLPLLTVGLSFSVLGALKIYGLSKGVVGGGGRPLTCRILGSCPTWSKSANLLVIVMFCAIGIVNLSVVVVILLAR